MKEMFSEEEAQTLWAEGITGAPGKSAALRVATHVVKLVAARGGTMTADAFAAKILRVHAGHIGWSEEADALKEAFTTQGARLVMVEAELQRTRELAQSYLDAATITDARGNTETLSPGAIRLYLAVPPRTP